MEHKRLQDDYNKGNYKTENMDHTAILKIVFCFEAAAGTDKSKVFMLVELYLTLLTANAKSQRLFSHMKEGENNQAVVVLQKIGRKLTENENNLAIGASECTKNTI